MRVKVPSHLRAPAGTAVRAVGILGVACVILGRAPLAHASTDPVLQRSAVPHYSYSGVSTDGSLAVATNKQRNVILYRYGRHGSFSDPVNLGGHVYNTPSLSRYGSSYVIAVRGVDNHDYVKTGTPNHWSGWRSIGGLDRYGPAVTGDSRGHFRVFITDTKHHLAVKGYAYGGQWSTWADIGLGMYLASGPAAFTAEPVASSPGDPVVAISAVGTFERNCGLAYWPYSPSFQRLGLWGCARPHTTSSRPTLIGTGTKTVPGGAILVVRGVDGSVYRYDEASEEWKWLGGKTTTTPAVTETAGGPMISVVGTDRVLYTERYYGPPNSWTRA